MVGSSSPEASVPHCLSGYVEPRAGSPLRVLPDQDRLGTALEWEGPGSREVRWSQSLEALLGGGCDSYRSEKTEPFRGSTFSDPRATRTREYGELLSAGCPQRFASNPDLTIVVRDQQSATRPRGFATLIRSGGSQATRCSLILRYSVDWCVADPCGAPARFDRAFCRARDECGELRYER